MGFTLLLVGCLIVGAGFVAVVLVSLWLLLALRIGYVSLWFMLIVWVFAGFVRWLLVCCCLLSDVVCKFACADVSAFALIVINSVEHVYLWWWGFVLG